MDFSIKKRIMGMNVLEIKMVGCWFAINSTVRILAALNDVELMGFGILKVCYVRIDIQMNLETSFSGLRRKRYR